MPQQGTKGTNEIKGLCLFYFLCFLLIGFPGCKSRAPAEVTIAHEVSPQPPRVGPATITLCVTDASGKALTGARIKLEVNMSHAGMSPVFAEATEVEPGRYQANIELSMAGDYVILVHLTLSDGAKIERPFEIKGVAPA